ncbi:Hypothetical predicted protein [Paramuricea clavata]|uniref:Uncharacterized protein n=1 Tax=Paramuricea clavata TaxID=317549 RepID=A0A7D9EKH7_PARCT|nr:Hypothetical predicted protein [Paramuricea clavata]
MEISAFRLALPLDVLRMVKSTIVPTMTTTSGENDDREDTFIANPWAWERKLLFHYAGQETVLAERMNFIETCKQKSHESIAEFESRCKYHGSKCEYNKMRNPKQELIRDRFVTGIHNDLLLYHCPIRVTRYKIKSALLGAADSIKLELIKYDKSRVHMSNQNKTAVATDIGCSVNNDDNCFMSSDSKGNLAKDEFFANHSKSFSGFGNLGKPVSFVLDPKVHPVHAPIHRIPVAKRDRVKKKLDEMVAAKEEPTDWCSNMTVVETVKENGEVKTRLYLDPSQTVNKAIVRPKYTIPTLEELLPKLSPKTYKCFTIIDALEEEIHEALDSLEVVFNIADDVLTYGLGSSPEEAEAAHDKHLNYFMKRVLERNLKLNPSKVLGMVNYLHTFCSALSDVVHPLQNLIKSDIQFVWSEVHDKAFNKAKELIANAPCLAYFDPSKLVVFQVDASETDLGGAMLQPTAQGKL